MLCNARCVGVYVSVLRRCMYSPTRLALQGGGVTNSQKKNVTWINIDKVTIFIAIVWMWTGRPWFWLSDVYLRSQPCVNRKIIRNTNWLTHFCACKHLTTSLYYHVSFWWWICALPSLSEWLDGGPMAACHSELCICLATFFFQDESANHQGMLRF